MFKTKLFAVVLVVLMLCTLCVSVSAEDTAFEIRVTYTSDCAVKTGVYATASLDALTGQMLLLINDNLPAGYVIYDDGITEYIDGIRVNGQTVTSLQVPIEPDTTCYEIVVKTTYAEGFVGALAQMSDGTYDWTKLLENPIGLLTALYYMLATCSILVSLILVFRGKSSKAKSAAEISKAVTDAAHAAAQNTIENEVLPIVSAFQNTAQSLVKAYALTTSKSKEAPVALLDVLNEVAAADAATIIAQAKEYVEASKNKAEVAKQNTINKLNEIANASQEALSNGTKTTGAEDLAIF